MHIHSISPKVTVNIIYCFLVNVGSFYLLVHSSIGMAKAALEAINGCNLFGEKGASWSVIFVDIDAHNRNRSIFETLLPRESSSKVRVLLLLCCCCDNNNKTLIITIQIIMINDN